MSINKINAKNIYQKIVKTKFKKPTAQKNISNKLNDPTIEWSIVYRRIYKTTIDVKVRAFQYKILNNCLYLNHMLYVF